MVMENPLYRLREGERCSVRTMSKALNVGIFRIHEIEQARFDTVEIKYVLKYAKVLDIPINEFFGIQGDHFKERLNILTAYKNIKTALVLCDVKHGSEHLRCALKDLETAMPELLGSRRSNHNPVRGFPQSHKRDPDEPSPRELNALSTKEHPTWMEYDTPKVF